MIRLYHYEPTANSAKALIALHEKELIFESRWVDLHRFEQHEPEFLALNSNGQVPVLVVDDDVVTESTVIMEYLDEAFPGVQLRPHDPVARARMRTWTKFVDEYFCPALALVSFQTFVRPTAKALTPQELHERVSRVPLHEQRERWLTIAGDGYPQQRLDEGYRQVGFSMARAEAVLSRTPWLAGSSYSLADIACFSMAIIVAAHFPEHCNEHDHPNCWDWLARIRERRAVRAALAHSRLI
jgi:glutathione S-transferase